MRNDNSNMEFFKQMFGGSWIAQGLSVAAELGIADLLADGPRTVEDLAERTNTNSSALYRVLRALASVGIFAQDETLRFSSTPLADLLRSDTPGTQRSIAIMMGSEFYAAWGELLHSVRTGEPGFRKRYGASWVPIHDGTPRAPRYLRRGHDGGPRRGDRTDAGRLRLRCVRTDVDIGGGNGRMLVAILDRHPTLQGVLFDLPAVVDRTRLPISRTGRVGPYSDRGRRLLLLRPGRCGRLSPATHHP